jgi:DNA-binding GntR family transcriptional regulator
MTEVSSPRELDITLERNSPVPLYFQLARSIEHAITSGELAAGDRLENEVSMTRRLGLSRPTARQAIQELVNKGLLVRKRGVGTQVIHSQFSREERLTSLYDDLEQAGKVPSTRLLDYRLGGLDEDVRRAIDVSDAASMDFLAIRRLRLADDMPLAILSNYLPARYQVSERDLQSHGLYAALRAAGVNLKIAHQRIGARLLTADEAGLLAETVPAAGLTAERIAYDDTGRLVEYGRHVYRATHYSVQSSLVV